MKQINYSGRDLLTGDRIADAIMNYATALARRTRADRVDVPVIVAGRLTHVELILGPASQILVEAVDNDTEDPIDDTLVQELELRTARLHHPRPIATTQQSDAVAENLHMPGDIFD